MEFGPAPLPPELRPFRLQAEAYAQARIQRFAHAFARRINPNLTKEQVDYVTAGVINEMAALQEPMQVMPQQNLRLVLRHDCLSSGCGDNGCALCQYNPSRICKRNLKNKYLIDDHLRAKCGAGLRVEVVDEHGQCVNDPLPDMELEVHVLNGEKYKEVCPDNTLLNNMQLRGCIIQPNAKKPLLKRESALGSVSEEIRIFLPVENGQAPLSDLQCTTSSEALLLGKAPTFRLLVWAIDRHGTPLTHVTYVVSESFVVATKRVKHAIKSDIPSIGDHISKLVHVGKATVDKLQDIRQAGAEENLEVDLPDHLNKVDKVGQFRELVEMTEQNSDLKHKLRHLLKLSPEKWEEVTQHALLAVVPDFRPRVWWYPAIQGGLLFPCKNGAVQSEQPVAFVHREAAGGVETITPIQQVDALLYNLLPKLKQQAMQDWFAPGHTGWVVYWLDPADPLAQQLQPNGPNAPNFMTMPMGVVAAAAMSTTGNDAAAAVATAAAATGMGMGIMHSPGAPGLPGGLQPPSLQGMGMTNGMSPQQMSPQLLAQQQQQQQQQQPSPQMMAQQQTQQQVQHYPQYPAAQQQQQQLLMQQQQFAPVLLPPQVKQQGRQSSLSGGGVMGPPPASLPPSAPNSATATSAAAAAASGAFAMPAVPPVSVPLPGQQRHSVPGYSTVRSPFATQLLQSTLSAQFPKWPHGAPSPAATPTSQQGQSAGGAAGHPAGQSQGGAAQGNVSSAGGAAAGRQSHMGQQQHEQMQQHAHFMQLQQQQQQQHMQQQQQLQQHQQQQHQLQQHQQQQQHYQGSAGGTVSAGGAAGPASAAAGDGGHPAAGMSAIAAAPALQPAPPSLEMLNTDDLPVMKDPSWSLGTLGTLDSFAHMQMLAELPSAGVGSMLGEVGAAHQAAAAHQGACAAHPAGAMTNGVEGDDDGQPERALSLKFSMSLDLEEYNKPTAS